MADLGVALIGAGSHQFTPAQVEAAGAEIVFSVEAPGNLEAAIESANGASVSGAHLVSIMFAPVSERVTAACVALELGCNVVLERPAGLSSADLTRLDQAAVAGGVKFWERATTAFEQHYRRIGALIKSGALGEIVLISFQRSYPWAEWRNSDETESGGLVLQSASYGLDFVCNIAMLEVLKVNVVETTLGEPKGRTLRMAAAVTAELRGGALAAICVDYLNPATDPWAREEIRVLGSLGRLELNSADGNLKIINSDGIVTERPELSESSFLSEVISAIRAGGDTDPSAAALALPSRILLAARQGGHSSWRSYAGEGWTA